MNKNDSASNKYEFLNHLLYLPRGIERLAKLGTVQHFPKGTELNTLNSVPTNCYLVKSGRVICYEISFIGEQRIFNFLEPGSVFLEECVLFDKPCPVIFKTQTASELIVIDKCDLKRAMKHDLDVVMDICESLAVKYLSSMEDIRTMPQQSATWKIARLLLNFAEHYGICMGKRVLIQERINQQLLADLLGMNRVTVTRKLKEMKDHGLIGKTEGYYYITDIDLFRAYMMNIQAE